ncbi:MAG: MmcQ/YjbR family DNA-binding protein [Candidatus Promineifilaceae bacterium]
MDRETLTAYILNKKGAFEDRPFGPETAVFKVVNKMFALIPDGEPLSMNLKCGPDEAIFLRQMYSAVQPGYHMNKRHWNTITVDGNIPDEELCQMVDTSYNLVVKSLKKTDREALNG